MKRFMALLLVLVSLIILTASAKNSASIPYSDNYFSLSSLARNDALAYSSALLADAAYQPGRIEEGFMAMGFEHPRLDNYQNLEQGLTDYTASAISRKNIILNGNPYDLFAIVVRGTHDDIEWVSNFNLGWGWDHAGFVQAESDLMENFREYYIGLEKNGIIDRNRDNNIIWITGHSRGASVANLLAVQLRDYSYCPSEKIYAYTFACPRVTLQSIDQNNYQYIYNYNILADIFPHLPSSGILNSGYRLYGNIIELESFTRTHEEVVKEYEQSSGNSYSVLDKVMNHEMALYLSWLKVLNKGNSQTIKPGDTLMYGLYEQDNNLQNGKEPISWLVLSVEGNRVLLLSDKCLDAQPYNSGAGLFTWETCSLRSWLNNDFYNTSFSNDERNRVLDTRLDNTDALGEIGNSNGGNETNDRVFLLSWYEFDQYLNDDQRRAVPTEYARARYYSMYNQYTEDGSNNWWLRSTGYSEYGDILILSDGYPYVSGDFQDLGGGLIRPALWISR